MPVKIHLLSFILLHIIGSTLEHLFLDCVLFLSTLRTHGFRHPTVRYKRKMPVHVVGRKDKLFYDTSVSIKYETIS